MRLVLFLYPWLELLSLIQLGVETNALFAVAWVFLMFLLGGAMIRRVGTASVMRLREAQRSGVLQQNLLVDDMAVVVAGLLFVIPGLLSDFFALVVLIGPLRRALSRSLFGKADHSASVHDGADRHQQHFSTSRGNGRYAEGAHHTRVTLEGDYERVDDEEDK